MAESLQDSEFLEDELKSLKAKITDLRSVELIACHKALIQARIKYTDYKHVVVNLQFSSNYPSTPLLVELKSKVLPDKILKKIEEQCDQELRKHLGNKQILTIINFLCEFISNTPFLVCSEEISYLKNELFRVGDEMKIKQKAGVINYKAIENRYFLDFKLTIPFDYPAAHVLLEFKDTNLPANLFQMIKGQANELIRQCVEAPVKRKPSDTPFIPRPSIQLILKYLVIDCLRRIPSEHCHICKETALPPNPKDVVCDEGHSKYVYRMYCGHLYHHHCLDTYMKTPPFTGGKKCVSCGQRIFHEKWKIPPKLAEERWAHQEARKREIAEVAEFLGFD